MYESEIHKKELNAHQAITVYDKTKGVENIKVKKALFLTLWFHSFLVWLYIIARIVVNHVHLGSLFIDSVPFFTFTTLGIVAFVASMIFMFIYLKEA